MAFFLLMASDFDTVIICRIIIDDAFKGLYSLEIIIFRQVDIRQEQKGFPHPELMRGVHIDELENLFLSLIDILRL